MNRKKAQKLTLLFICIFLNFNLISQNPIDDENSNYLSLKGGYFYDIDNNSRKGLNLLNLGYRIHNHDRAQSFEFEYVVFNTISDSIRNPNTYQLISGFERNQITVEFIYSYGILFSKNVHEFSFGPTVSLLVRLDKLSPYSTNYFPTLNTTIAMGIGLNANYFLNVYKKLDLSLSSRFTLLDIGEIRQRIENPVLPENLQQSSAIHIDFSRNEYHIAIGLRYKL